MQKKRPQAVSMNLQGVGVLCIDNEQDILSGMNELLSAWQCNLFTAVNAQQAKEIYADHEDEIDILLVDFQLTGNQSDNEQFCAKPYSSEKTLLSNFNDKVNGIELIQQLRIMSDHSLPAILITASTHNNLMTLAKQADIGYLRKIIKPIALRSLMSALLSKELKKNYSHKT